MHFQFGIDVSHSERGPQPLGVPWAQDCPSGIDPEQVPQPSAGPEQAPLSHWEPLLHRLPITSVPINRHTTGVVSLRQPTAPSASAHAETSVAVRVEPGNAN